MANDYFDSADYTALTRITLARAEAVNAILDAVVVGFDQLPAIRELREGRVTYATDASVAANAILLTLPYTPDDYQAGLLIFWKNSIAVTSASTINASSLGVKSLKRYDGTATESGDLPANAIGVALYDGTNFQLLWPVGSILAEATAQADAAAASAVAAAASASAASGSATAAATSASAASTSAAASAASAAASAASAGSSGRYWLGTPGGTGDAMTTTVDLPTAAWLDGNLIEFIWPGTTTIAAPTIENTFEGIAPVTLKDPDGNALAVGAGRSGRLGRAIYHATSGFFRLQNPSVSLATAQAGTAVVGDMTPERVAQAIQALAVETFTVYTTTQTGANGLRAIMDCSAATKTITVDDSGRVAGDVFKVRKIGRYTLTINMGADYAQLPNGTLKTGNVTVTGGFSGTLTFQYVGTIAGGGGSNRVWSVS